MSLKLARQGWEFPMGFWETQRKTWLVQIPWLPRKGTKGVYRAACSAGLLRGIYTAAQLP